MRLAIVATPPLALVAILTAGLALRPHPNLSESPPPQDERSTSGTPGGIAMVPAPPTCDHAHGLVVSGDVTGGASHVELAGPIIYSDVTTDRSGHFELHVPIADNVCSLLAAPQDYSFSDGTMSVRYSVAFE